MSNHFYLEALAENVRLIGRPSESPELPLWDPVRVDHGPFSVGDFEIRIAHDADYREPPAPPSRSLWRIFRFGAAKRKERIAIAGSSAGVLHPRGKSRRRRETIIGLDEHYARLLRGEVARLEVPAELVLSDALELESSGLRSAVRHRVNPPPGPAVFAVYLSGALEAALLEASESIGLPIETIIRNRVCTRLHRRHQGAARKWPSGS
jgi:hypothetical protein